MLCAPHPTLDRSTNPIFLITLGPLLHKQSCAFFEEYLSTEIINVFPYRHTYACTYVTIETHNLLMHKICIIRYHTES